MRLFTQTKSQSDQSAERMADLIEVSLTQFFSLSEPRTFSPFMVVDMCGGWFSAYVVSVEQSGAFRIMPRTIRIEASEQVLNGVERTRACAYRPTQVRTWKACTPTRLAECSKDSSVLSVDNIIQYGLELPRETRVMEFGRLWHALLAPLWQTDSGHDYYQVFVIVDSPDARALIEAALPMVASKHSLNATQWAQAAVLDESAEPNLPACLFINGPVNLSRFSEVGLYINDRSEASIYRWKQGVITREETLNTDSIRHCTQAVIVSSEFTEQKPQPNVRVLNSAWEARCASMAGYVYTLTQTDERSLERLVQVREELFAERNEALDKKQVLQALMSRFSVIFARLNSEVPRRGLNWH